MKNSTAIAIENRKRQKLNVLSWQWSYIIIVVVKKLANTVTAADLLQRTNLLVIQSDYFKLFANHTVVLVVRS